MEIICGGRGYGKTKRIIEIAAKNFSYIVCINQREAKRVWGIIRQMGLIDKVPNPITFTTFAQGHYCGRGIRSFVFDNVDLAIQSMTSVPIKAMSLTDDDDIPKWKDFDLSQDWNEHDWKNYVYSNSNKV